MQFRIIHKDEFMSISLAAARELQHRVRIEPKSAPAVVGDLIAEINSLSYQGTVTGRLPSSCPSFQNIPKQVPPETTEQREQRLLDELDTVRKAKEEAAEAAKAEDAKKVRLDAILRAVDLSLATTDVFKAIFGQLNYNSGDVLSRDTWWKFRKDLAPVVAVHGFKLVNVGTKSKPRAALAEV